MRQNERLIAWFIAMVLALLFVLFQVISCATVYINQSDKDLKKNVKPNRVGVPTQPKSTNPSDSVSLRE